MHTVFSVCYYVMLNSMTMFDGMVSMMGLNDRTPPPGQRTISLVTSRLESEKDVWPHYTSSKILPGYQLLEVISKSCLQISPWFWAQIHVLHDVPYKSSRTLRTSGAGLLAFILPDGEVLSSSLLYYDPVKPFELPQCMNCAIQIKLPLLNYT